MSTAYPATVEDEREKMEVGLSGVPVAVFPRPDTIALVSRATTPLAAVDNLQRESTHPPPPTLHVVANACESGEGAHAGTNIAARVERLEAQADARHVGLPGSCRSGCHQPTRKIPEKVLQL
ncbi:hypothetical protein Bbelb_241130 [Branchiostoma belcheri]|nr:hypothetical protein Bbelb_241130 [Branchiostoma belcheri]